MKKQKTDNGNFLSGLIIGFIVGLLFKNWFGVDLSFLFIWGGLILIFIIIYALIKGRVELYKLWKRQKTYEKVLIILAIIILGMMFFGLFFS